MSARTAEQTEQVTKAVHEAIDLLTPRLRALVGNTGADFTHCLTALAPLASPEVGDLCTRAVQVRNRAAHQAPLFLRDLEPLARVAEEFGMPDLSRLIFSQRPKPTVETPKLTVNIIHKQQQPVIQQHTAADPSAVHELRAEPGAGWEEFKQRGNEHFSHGRFTEAMELYTWAIAKDHKQAVLYSNRALCAIRLKQFQYAREDAEEAIALDSKRTKYYALLAEALLGLEKFDEAEEACGAGLEVSPKDAALQLLQRNAHASAENLIYSGQPVPHAAEYMKCLLKPAGLVADMPQPLPPDKVRSLLEAQRLCNEATGLLQTDPRKAMDLYEQAAQSGYAFGMYCLAKGICDGVGNWTRDFYRADEILRRAAAQDPFLNVNGQLISNWGVPAAMGSIGVSFRDGRGVDTDNVQAADWFLKAADLGSPEAMNNIGNCLLHGTGVPKNEAAARTWFRKAADAGLAEPKLNLGFMLLNGQGGPADRQAAVALFSDAAVQGNPEAVQVLHDLKLRGDKRAAATFVGVSAKDAEAMYLQGSTILAGDPKHNDKREGVALLRAAADLGHVAAQRAAAQALLDSHEDPALGFEYTRKAAEAGDREAKNQLGLLYAYGVGCKRDTGVPSPGVRPTSRTSLQH
eukprot:TRINITY_DN157_c1_g2_i8.p1 TRINITY_DN157_c1_g2~~TRINITY_DN157_c1_g2_i8.p1  ORF type:complete len:632 (-),score=128.33 TRINITY_DN157_c1_g2_i8:44-1939(-)